MPADWNPGTQFVQGMQIGGNLATEGFNTGLRMQQLQSEDAERKVRERLYNQQMSDLIFKHDQIVQKQADMTKALARVQLESSSPIAGFMPSAGGGVTPVQNPNYAPFEDSMLKNVGPVMQKYGDDAGLRDLYYGKRVADQNRNEALKANQPEFQPRGIEVTMPDGRKVPMIQKGKGSFEVAPSSDVETTELQNPDGTSTKLWRQGTTGKWQRIPPDAGARQTKAFEQQNAQTMLKTALTSAMDKVKYKTDENGKPVAYVDPADWDEIKKRGNVTSAVQTKAESSLMATQKTIDAISNLEKTLRPGDVGPTGAIGGELFDIIGPSLGLNTADVKRMDNREKLRLLTEGALREVSVDQRFSNNDRLAIQEAMPKPGVHESYPHAMQTMSTLRNVFAKRSLIDAQTVGKPAPQWALMALDPAKIQEANQSMLIDDNAIRTLVKNGKITPEQGAQLQAERPKD